MAIGTAIGIATTIGVSYANGVNPWTGKMIHHTPQTTVSGHYPEYNRLADEIGANKFSLPKDTWNSMTPVEQWRANQQYLDGAILRGDNFRLATPINQVRTGSFYQQELLYLGSKGYIVSSDGLWLIKSK
jgi:hypothetical protein